MRFTPEASVCHLLARAPGLTAEHVRGLAAAAGGEPGRMCQPEVIARTDLPPAARRYLAAPDRAALRADLEWCAASGAHTLLCIDAAYPLQLAAIRSAPAALYVWGSVQALQMPQLAVVGSRSPTPAGRGIAREFAGALARSGLAITSGLAAGIDAASHEGALEAGGTTVAVLGAGLDRIYPAEHVGLARRIRDSGALVSEFPLRTRPQRHNFPRRNRIISGLALGTLVIEAAHGSGSLITARCALEQGREVFAVPGSIHSPLSHGCHRLIREGAQLVETPAEVLAEIHVYPQNQCVMPSAPDTPTAAALDKEYEMLLDALGFEPETLDTLAGRCGLSGESIASMLLILELRGCVAAYPGGRYGRVAMTTEQTIK